MLMPHRCGKNSDFIRFVIADSNRYLPAYVVGTTAICDLQIFPRTIFNNPEQAQL